jgi:hypothetical protein
VQDLGPFVPEASGTIDRDARTAQPLERRLVGARG